MTVANQTEVTILHYITVTLNTKIEDDSGQFTIPLAKADLKYNILGTPFEEYTRNINIQDFTLQFTYQSTVYPNCTNLPHTYPEFTHTFCVFIESIFSHRYI